jgi:uncharacterized Zn finger protein
MFPLYDFEKIKFGTNKPTFEKAVDLYEKGRVTKFESVIDGFSATVIGTKPYQVFVLARHYDYGNCECYLGQQEILCKHMVALAIYSLKRGKPLTSEEKKVIDKPICSGRLGELNKEKLSATKKAISSALRYIKPYIGPSRIWFQYQDSLSEGYNRLSVIISELPVSR